MDSSPQVLKHSRCSFPVGGEDGGTWRGGEDGAWHADCGKMDGQCMDER